MTSASQLEQSEEGRAFLEHRVSTAGRFGFAIGAFFLAYRLIQILIRQAPSELVHPSLLYHLFGALSMALMWMAARGGRSSVRFVRAVEVVSLLLACAFYSMMGLYIPLIGSPQYIVLLALAIGLIARAVYVPSTARRTTFITALSGIPLVVMTYWVWHNLDVDQLRRVADAGASSLFSGPADVPTSATVVALNTAAFTAAWWAATVAVCAGASRVIYGLRKQVHDVRKLGQYELIERLGEGGMGIVYRARHAMLRRPTAVKLLPLEKAGEKSIARFEKEVQQTARLTHANTVTVFDYGRTPEGVFYYAMELLEGATIAEAVDVGGPMPPARVIQVLSQAAAALAEAHGVGLIHRDIKPANIMLAKQGGQYDIAKLLDFGLVKQLEHDISASVTQADTITGTPQYMSPEAISDPEQVDGRSDLYGLGAVGYFMLVGDHLFDAKSVVEVCSKHLHEIPKRPSERLGQVLPQDLEELILHCLEKDPDERPQSAQELLDRLEACGDARKWTQRAARQWWSEHEDQLSERHRHRVASASGRTLEVDFARRAGLGA